MKKIIAIMVLVCFAGFANAQTVSINNSETAITLDLANTNWFANGTDSDNNVTTIGVSLYWLNNSGVFDSYMRINTQWDDAASNMMQPESKYGFTYGATMRVSNGVYAYGGLGFISDFGHNESLLGTANYGVLVRSDKFVVGLGDDTNAGSTLSVGMVF